MTNHHDRPTQGGAAGHALSGSDATGRGPLVETILTTLRAAGEDPKIGPHVRQAFYDAGAAVFGDRDPTGCECALCHAPWKGKRPPVGAIRIRLGVNADEVYGLVCRDCFDDPDPNARVGALLRQLTGRDVEKAPVL